jgi:hypothetical protein
MRSDRLDDVIPAQAGIQAWISNWTQLRLDSRLRGNDTTRQPEIMTP